MEFWDFSGSYDRALGHFVPYHTLQSLVAKYTRCIPYINILDLGAGTGNTTVALLNEYSSVRGITIDVVDVSDSMIQRASSKLHVPVLNSFKVATRKEKSVQPVRLFQCNANAFLKKAKEEMQIYDRVVAVNSLYTFGDYRETIRTIYSVLDDGGIFVVANPFLPKLKPIFAEHFSEHKISRAVQFARYLPDWFVILKKNLSIAKHSSSERFKFTTPEELRCALLDAGFSILDESTSYGGTVAVFACQKNEKNIRRAHTLEEIRETFKIRGAIYSTDVPSFNKEDLVDGMEFDAFDEWGIHFISKVDNAIVGCIRLIPDSEIGFIMEDHFPLPEWINRLYVLEASRDALLNEFRGRGLGRGVEEEAYRWSVRNGYHVWCFMINKALIPKLVPLWKPIQLGNEMLYHNTASTPMIRVL